MLDEQKSAASVNALTAAQALADAGQLFSSFGTFGIFWLCRDLIVRSRFGKLADFVDVGRPVCDSVLAFIGLEGEILALEQSPRRILELPAVGIADASGEIQRLNFSIVWQASQDAFLVLVYRVASQAELELELSRQIRARLMAEAEVTATSKALSRANADLESFAAVISHDLKAPMRHMGYLAKELLDCEPPSPDSGKRASLEAIAAQARRMSDMLTALLDYSSLGRKWEAIAKTDTRKIAEGIVQSLPKSEFAIEISGDWPEIETLAAPLDLVMRNLIGNALKHHDAPSGTISVRCIDAPVSIVISVSDDGPGIEPKHHEAVFLPFRTVAPKEDQAGSGMGLAMVKKAVDAVGGRISLASDPERRRGTTFTVVWPKYVAT